MDHDDHYTSHAFGNIFLTAIERHLENELEQSKTVLICSPTTTESTDTNFTDFVEDEAEENASATQEYFSIEQSTSRLSISISCFAVSLLIRICQVVSSEAVRSDSGRPPQERYTFMIEHPQASSHGIIKRLKPVIHVLIGPQIPRKDKEETKKWYSRALTTLFIPWRSVKFLYDVNQSWGEALSSRQGSISTESQQTIDNIQLLHECKKDRDAHLQQVTANVQASDKIDSRLFPRNMRMGSDEDDEDSDRNKIHLNLAR